MKYLKLGTIVNTHGLKGEVRVLCNYYGNNFPWQPKSTIYLHTNNEYQVLTITNVRQHKQFLLLTFAKHDKIELVEMMKTKDIVIDTDEINLDSLPWTYDDIMNYQAFDASNNISLGQVIDFVDNNHQGLWEIEMIDGNTFFIPNNKTFISKVDKTAKKVYFNMIEGLIQHD
ncbi:ribosome maturation factor RimM [Spiroplasma endosymbiont of Nebria brevicollis]|uniref:ribosome maturation factor RimM n=1 Tax=Spiroplasma endosymbiont of Nebria brevicollis TaxID=3066284 RepID=UPI00313EF6ED